jgi:hypothetical protein
MAESMKADPNFERVRSALKQAARDAITGPREARSGRLTATTRAAPQSSSSAKTTSKR